MNFRKLLKDIHDIQEETTSGDIATVDSKLGTKPIRHQGGNGKKCKSHKRVDCLECQKD
jgi:hypothetical protein